MTGRTNGKEKTFFPSDQIATEIASCIQRDLSKVPLFDRTFGSDILDQLRSRQIAGTLKRYQHFEGYDRVSLERDAFGLFTEVNERMRVFNERMRTPSYWDTPLPSREDITLSKIRLMSQNLIEWVLGSFWWGELHTVCKHGTGSTIGASYEDTSVDKKFTYPISCTQNVKALFDAHTRLNFTLNRAIEKLNTNFALGEMYDVVSASRGTTVDKTSSKRRLIAVEPTLNMFFQQGLMEMMYARLSEVGLDLESLPQRHRDLARQGSINRKYGTIDFSSASDSVSFELVRQFFPPDWFDALNTCRTPAMELGGHVLTLEMFSTMGNATTFPLETLSFWAIACSCHHIVTRQPGNLTNHKTRAICSVFGDDCILPTESCYLFIEVCKLLGFQINEEKSFVDPEQSFRESCGGDYYHGIDVRPYSFKAPRSQRLSSLEPWLYTILNNMLPIYTKYFGYYQSILTMGLGAEIFRLCAAYKLKFKLVPCDFPDDAGLRCSLIPHGIRPRLIDTFELLSNLGVSLSPIYKGSQGNLDFSYVKFSYPKDRRRFDELRYALWLYRACVELSNFERSTRDRRIYTHPVLHRIWLRSVHLINEVGEADTFQFRKRRAPLRRKGGYVVSRTVSRFY
jgi:hypothetical protein